MRLLEIAQKALAMHLELGRLDIGLPGPEKKCTGHPGRMVEKVPLAGQWMLTVTGRDHCLIVVWSPSTLPLSMSVKVTLTVNSFACPVTMLAIGKERR